MCMHTLPRRVLLSDVYAVWNILRHRRPNLPDEMILYILRHAEYHAREVSHKCKDIEPTLFCANRHFSSWRMHSDVVPSVAGFYSASLIAHDRIKSISFTITSGCQLQSWVVDGGQGTYNLNNDYTWFEASILKPFGQSDHPLPLEDFGNLPLTFVSTAWATDFLRHYGWDFKFVNENQCTWKVYHNISAQKTEYFVRWAKGEKAPVTEEEKGTEIGMGDGKGFLENVQPGDMVLLWARAKQRNWENFVEQATIVTEYEVS